MILASITLYGFVLAVHIIAVVVAFGATFAYPAFIPWARKHHPNAMPVIHGLTGRIGQRVISPAMVVVLLAGIYLASDADAWSETWVSVPFVILLVLGGMGGMFFAPNERKLVELSERDLANGGELSAEYDELYQRVALAGKIASVLVLVAIFFMAAKP